MLEPKNKTEEQNVFELFFFPNLLFGGDTEARWLTLE